MLLKFYSFLSVVVFYSTLNKLNAKAFEEEKKFIVAISEYSANSTQQKSKFLCYGTVISQRHVVTTADCVELESQGNRLVVDVQTVVDDGSGFLHFGSTEVGVENVFVHPKYTGYDRINHNIAVILMNAVLDPEIFAPKLIGKMVSNSTCEIYGWGGAPFIPRRLPVEVFKTILSDDGVDVEGFTSTFDMVNDPRCEVHRGSPVICGYPHSNFGGIVINKNRECSMVYGKTALEYVAVNEYGDWIREVSSGTIKHLSIGILLISVFITKF